ncbi:MAG: PVC-type heme-binding CxxCH protein, partial [Planctomycetaceae bacterium]
GTTNPWGLDFDDYGQMFITNCVIKHLFHVIPGGHYRRMFGRDLNPHTYELMTSCADHIHWGGGNWQSSRGGYGIHDKPGGGHAHSGAMIYLGDNWPPFMRNRLLTCNLHGNRVNCDTLKPQGSGYTASHAHDFLIANDSWFRGLELKYGPDGAVFVSDWSDTGECHDYDHCDRIHGRIYKVSYGRPEPVTVDLNRLDNAELVQLQLRRNEWYVRHARRILAERAATGAVGDETFAALHDILRNHSETSRRLRALWALSVSSGIDQQGLLQLLDDPDEHLRSWSIRLLCGSEKTDARSIAKLAEMARSDASPLVRVTLASILQRIALDDRWPIVEALVSHAGDAADANIPLMIWYGLEPLVAADRSRALRLVVNTKIPLLRRFIARRVAD